MKKIRLVILTTFLVFLGMTTVSAEALDNINCEAKIKYTNKNTTESYLLCYNWGDKDSVYPVVYYQNRLGSVSTADQFKKCIYAEKEHKNCADKYLLEEYKWDLHFDDKLRLSKGQDPKQVLNLENSELRFDTVTCSVSVDNCRAASANGIVPKESCDLLAVNINMFTCANKTYDKIGLYPKSSDSLFEFDNDYNNDNDAPSTKPDSSSSTVQDTPSKTQQTYKKITCGDMQVPLMAADITSKIIQVLKIATPIIIIIFGSLDLIKGVIAQKEDEIKKGQQTFIQRLIVGCIVFLAFIIVEFVIGLVKPHNENPNMWNCINCFVTGDCKDITIN